jgi:hypothetical protein
MNKTTTGLRSHPHHIVDVIQYVLSLQIWQTITMILDIAALCWGSDHHSTSHHLGAAERE